MSLFMLSLAGFPPLAGFAGKFYMFRSAVLSGHTPLAVVGVLNSLLSVAFYLRVIVSMYMEEGGSAGKSFASRRTSTLPSTLAVAWNSLSWIAPARALSGAGPLLFPSIIYAVEKPDRNRDFRSSKPRVLRICRSLRRAARSHRRRDSTDPWPEFATARLKRFLEFRSNEAHRANVSVTAITDAAVSVDADSRPPAGSDWEFRLPLVAGSIGRSSKARTEALRRRRWARIHRAGLLKAAVLSRQIFRNRSNSLRLAD